jgi:hypothetical protein
MESSKRTGEKNNHAETGDEPGIADENADKRKAKVKCFFDGERPKDVPLVNIPPKMN